MVRWLLLSKVFFFKRAIRGQLFWRYGNYLYETLGKFGTQPYSKHRPAKFAVFANGVLLYAHVYAGRGAITSIEGWPEQIYVHTEKKEKKSNILLLLFKAKDTFCLVEKVINTLILFTIIVLNFIAKLLKFGSLAWLFKSIFS